jgi:hypothetical protein
MNNNDRFTWPDMAFNASVFDADSRDAAFTTGIPAGLGLQYLTSPENHKQAGTGREYLVIAIQPRTPGKLAIDADGRVWALGPRGRTTFVNNSLGKFSKSMEVAMKTNAPLQGAEDRGDQAAMDQIKDWLRTQFNSIDPLALRESDSWWSSFLIDI